MFLALEYLTPSAETNITADMKSNLNARMKRIGIIHRDFEDRNMRLAEDGHLYVFDFADADLENSAPSSSEKEKSETPSLIKHHT
ncbi:unnamed protein product [Ambrosiozyma monospora]|uniref:Unnamed protein product n=1 Tax=Ambrosiozyma monospora TaxID=43982 RepID=A0ACB5T5H3_AMBMO|nr:unnamed protein product [Ambrosiozyma monospora]